MRLTPTSWRPIALALPLGALAAAAARLACVVPDAYDALLEANPPYAPVFAEAGVGVLVELFWWSLVAGAAGLAIASFCALFARRRWSLSVVRKGALLVPVLAVVLAMAVCKATGALSDANVFIGGAKPDSWTVFFARWAYLKFALLAMIAGAIPLVLAYCEGTIRLYTGASDGPAAGDRLLERLRLHRLAPSYRKSLYHSLGLHVFVILVLPWLLSLHGCVDAYRIPKGEGAPVVERKVQVVRKKKPKKRFVVNPNSAIIFDVPDDMMLMRDVDKQSQVEYAADPNRVHGKMGQGKGGKGGWPDGMDDAVVRFIRLEHGGPGWDDGMDARSNADRNFLQEFKKVTGFKVASNGESIRVGQLKQFPKGGQPPFVYLTGSGDIRMSPRDIEILRSYLLDGGLLFADAGSPWFHQNFMSLSRALFPGNPLRDIADDDPIYQMPYVFPNGAPPLWHHGGWRAMGIKHKDRWVIYYHPGDVNDTWKDDRGGMTKELSQSAMDLGVNIIYYSFTHYLEMTRKYRK